MFSATCFRRFIKFCLSSSDLLYFPVPTIKRDLKVLPDILNFLSNLNEKLFLELILISLKIFSVPYSLKIKHDTIGTFSSYEIYVRNDKLIIDHYDTHDELINSYDYDKRTALHLACSECHINIISTTIGFRIYR